MSKPFKVIWPTSERWHVAFRPLMATFLTGHKGSSYLRKQGTIGDAESSQRQLPEVHGDHRTVLGIQVVALDEDNLGIVSRVMLPRGKCALVPLDWGCRPSRSAGHLELAEVGTELGEDARTREADLIPEEHGPRLLASQAGLDLVGPAVVEVVEHGGPELGKGFVDVV